MAFCLVLFGTKAETSILHSQFGVSLCWHLFSNDPCFQQPKAKEEHHLTTPPSAISSGIKRKMWLPLEEDEERMKFIRKVQLGDGVVDTRGSRWIDSSVTAWI
jgi:hypothetical protein